MQICVAALLMIGYFVAMLVISLNNVSTIQVITKEMNVLAQAESYYSFAQNVQKEMIYNPEKVILGHNAFEVVKDTLEQVYRLNLMIKQHHYQNRKVLSKDFKSVYNDIYYGNLCEEHAYIKLDLIPFHCETFIAETTEYVSLIMCNVDRVCKQCL